MKNSEYLQYLVEQNSQKNIKKTIDKQIQKEYNVNVIRKGKWKMKRFDIGDLLVFVLGVVLLMAMILGGFYMVGYMVELIATNINPAVITAVCIIFITVVVNLVLDNKI